MPLPDGAFRVLGVEAASTGLDPRTVRLRREEPLDTEAPRTSMVRITGDDWGPRTMRRGSRNTDTTRHAEHNRVGRVFLVGDAAHIHLPAGGQGLNAGAQDAANPVWKFATEVQGRASKHPRTGPHSYEAERLPVARRPSPVARRLAANTLAQDAASMNFTAANAALRDLLGELIDQRGDTVATLVGCLSGLEVHYPAPAGAAHPLEGHRTPDLMTERGRLHSLLAPRHLLVGLDGRAVDTTPT
ncbi:FAD-dependent monooxygenase [Streptomyces sp. NPDC052701]|uniref:FAD-dependent monooxygenase n=1 Tax=Streptomyces sp. NPDC052701 TaxID=3155533 RepID=UPI003416AB96